MLCEINSLEVEKRVRKRERGVCPAGNFTLNKILRCVRARGEGPDVTHALRASQAWSRYCRDIGASSGIISRSRVYVGGPSFFEARIKPD